MRAGKSEYLFGTLTEVSEIPVETCSSKNKKGD
jgi:hypothetical protein